jgi:hypothetical protein
MIFDLFNKMAQFSIILKSKIVNRAKRAHEHI